MLCSGTQSSDAVKLVSSVKFIPNYFSLMKWSWSLFLRRDSIHSDKGWDRSKLSKPIPVNSGVGLGKLLKTCQELYNTGKENRGGTSMRDDIRMLAASGELRWCLADDRKGYNSGLEPNSSFTWLQTGSPLGFSPAMLRKLFFFPFEMELQFQYLCMHSVRKSTRPFPEAQLLFKGKQRSFWR